jgi:hypothetical protein
MADRLAKTADPWEGMAHGLSAARRRLATLPD